MEVWGLTVIRRFILSGVLVLGAVAGTFGLGAASASAEVTHSLVGSITECKGGPLVQPWGLTFDSTGNLFVGEPEGRVVDLYNAANTCTSQIGLGEFPEEYTRSVAVNNKTGYVYVAESGPEAIFVFKPEGAGKYKLVQTVSLELFLYVAIDNSTGPNKGDLYVISGNAKVDVLKPNGEGELGEGNEEEAIPSPPKLTPPAGGFALTGENARAGLAVDGGSGELYLAEPTHNAVSEYGPEGTFQKKLEGKETPAKSFEPTGVAVEDSTGDIYVLDNKHKVIDQFARDGKYLGQIKALAEPLGLAVQNGAGATEGEIYVSDGAQIKIYSATPRPMFYECKKLATKPYTGKYTDKKCSIEATAKEKEEGKKNRYDLVPGTGAKGKPFKGKGGVSALHIPGGSVDVTCKTFKDEGTIATPTKLSKTVVEFKSCEMPAKKKCTSTGQKAGTVKTNNLAGVLGYISKSPLKVGLALSAESGSVFAEFTCEGGTEVVVTGAAIGEQKGDINTFNKAFEDAFTVNGEKLQSTTSFENGAQEELLSKVNGSGPFASGLQLAAANKGEEVEVKA